MKGLAHRSGSWHPPHHPQPSLHPKPQTPNLGLSVGSGSACVTNPTLVLVWEFWAQGAEPCPLPHGSPRLRHRTHQKTLTLLQNRKPKGRARAEVAGAVACVEFA